MKVLKALHRLPVVLVASLAATASGAAENVKQVQVMPNEIKWTAVPAAPGLKLSWLIGGQDKPGLYELRVHLDKGAVVPPHTHPDRRCVTVLTGELYAAEGSTVDTTRIKRFPAGSFHCVEAKVPHYVLAKDSEVVFQDSGTGPTGTVWIKK
jgi:quercetin dioxygenase-like cupin family protein